MTLEATLQERSNNCCELCGSSNSLDAFPVEPVDQATNENHAWLCTTCRTQLQNPDMADVNHWRCLNDAMWSAVPAVQVLAWRMLNALRHEGWPADLLDMLYLDDETLAWAKAGQQDADDEQLQHRDSNGALLETGDTVTLIKDLNVKGGGFTAKRGTAVRNISLVHDNPEHIEGKVNGQQIVILTQYVKKQKSTSVPGGL